MPVRDADVAITEFLGTHQPFRGIVKQTVDDFVVNEILLSGKVARITQLARPSRPRQIRETREENNEIIGPQNVDDASFDKLDALFESSSNASAVIRAALQESKTSVTLPVCGDKQTRTQIHAWVRENLPAFVTDTIDTGEGQAIRLRRKDTCRPWKRRRVDERGEVNKPDATRDETYDPREGKDKTIRSLHVGPRTFVQFTLWKRNRDTTEALSVLAKILRVSTDAFSYAGTKDKRAVTTQLVQVRGISEGRFAHANRVLQTRDRGARSIAIGNIEPAPRGTSRPLGLGDLRGNRFTLVLRDLELGKDGGTENVMAAVDSVKERGFVNYYGLQRFGSGVSPTHETGFAALRGDFEDVCRRILLPLRVEDEKEGLRPERKRFVDAMEKFAKREIRAEELMEDLPRWMHIERTVVESFVDDERRGMKKYDYKKAFGRLPRNLKKMYGHAVQSYLWNVMASERVRRSRPNIPEQMFAIEGDVIPVSAKPIKDFSYQTSTKEVTKDEGESRSISVCRVLIPVLGSEVSVPDADYASAAQRILEEQRIDLKSKLCAEFGMKGTYRPLISKPVDVESNIVQYSDRRENLVNSGVEHLEDPSGADSAGQSDKNPIRGTGKEESPVSQKLPAADHESTFPTKFSKNKDGYEKATPDLSDRTAVNSQQSKEGHSLPETDGLKDKTDANQCSGNEGIVVGRPRTEKTSTNENANALIITFTLGCAEYATMMVRELTRQDSSTASQKASQDGVAITHSKNETKRIRLPSLGKV